MRNRRFVDPYRLPVETAHTAPAMETPSFEPDACGARL